MNEKQRQILKKAEKMQDIALSVLLVLLLVGMVGFVSVILCDTFHEMFESDYIEIEKEIIVEVPTKEIVEIEIERAVPMEIEALMDASTYAMLTRVVMSESGNQALDAKMAVLWTIQNRVDSSDYPNTYFEVLYQANQYSLSDNGEPNEECYKAVDLFIEQVNDGIEAFPKDMYFFRTDYFHEGTKAYAKIDDLYFSCK